MIWKRRAEKEEEKKRPARSQQITTDLARVSLRCPAPLASPCVPCEVPRVVSRRDYVSIRCSLANWSIADCWAPVVGAEVVVFVLVDAGDIYP